MSSGGRVVFGLQFIERLLKAEYYIVKPFTQLP